MTVILLSEKEKPITPEISHTAQTTAIPMDPQYIRIIKALTNLSDRVTSELEESKRVLEEKNQLLSQLLKVDGLTQLYNHKFIHQSLEREVKKALRYKRDLCVGMIDLDHFKKINDTYGHGVGDQILIQLAACIKRGCRETDLVGRYGGDEIAVIFPEINLQGGETVMERVRCHVEAQVFEPEQLRVTISCGVAQLDRERPRALIDLADKRLYQAKKLGRNRVVARETEVP